MAYPYHDLREYMEACDQAGEMVTIRKEVQTEPGGRRHGKAYYQKLVPQWPLCRAYAVVPRDFRSWPPRSVRAGTAISRVWRLPWAWMPIRRLKP